MRFICVSTAILIFVACTESGDQPETELLAAVSVPYFQHRQLDTVASASMLALPFGRLEQQLRIDGHERDLAPIEHVLVGPTGDIVVSQQQGDRLLAFAANGDPGSSFGAHGSGPGEFRTLSRVGWWRGDSIWVVDVMQGRLTVIAPDFADSRSVQIGVTTGMVDNGSSPFVYRSSVLVGVTPDGRLIRSLGGTMNQVIPPSLPKRPIAVIERGGGASAILDTLPSVAIKVRTSSSGIALPSQFANEPQFATAHDGSRLAVVSPPPVASTSPFIVATVTAVDGQRVFSRAYALDPAPLPRTVWDSMTAAIAPALRRTNLTRVMSEIEPPTIYTPVLGVTVGNDYRLWIQVREADGTHYLALSPEGDPLGKVALPQTSLIQAADGDLIYVVEEDEYGVDSVVRYRVNW